MTDLYCSLATVIEVDPFEFPEKIIGLLENHTSEYPRIWEDYYKAVPEPEFAYSEMAAVGALMKSLPKKFVLHPTNNSVVRHTQLYVVSPTIEVCCNRGTSGIEGSLPTAVGYAATSDKLNFATIGDLNFFYDTNALQNINIGSNLHIPLSNNGDGGVFHTLPGLEMLETSYRFITAVHKTSAKGWVGERGLLYLRAENDGQLAETMRTFTCPETAERPILLEVFTDKDEDIRMLKNYYHQLKQNINYADTKGTDYHQGI